MGFSLPTFVTKWRRSAPVQEIDEANLSMEEYCAIRLQQWASQARKPYGPVPGAAVVADDRGWREWEKYDLASYVLDSGDKNRFKVGKAIDFGCGVGRVMKQLAPAFARIDGTDLLPSVLKGAVELCGSDRVRIGSAESVTRQRADNKSVLFASNGYNLAGVPNSFYDLVYSVVCFIHILHPGVRQNLYREFYRVLAKGGVCHLMFFMSKSQSFGGANRIVTSKGAFAFRNIEEARNEFSRTDFIVRRIREAEPIALDREGGVEKYLFVDLVKNESRV